MTKVISCPKCNYQYLPGEIFDPKHFLGQPKNIIRNSVGEILGYEGILMDTTETFTCENCNHTFKVIGKVNLTIDTPTVDNDSTKNINIIKPASLF